MPLNQGQVINNRYRIVRLLGQGGFGAVYRAYDLTLRNPCAVKENLELSAESQRQFEQEALILAGLRHPNLPRVYDHFVIPGQGQYLVMDFVEGEDLQSMLDRIQGPLREDQAIQWILQVLDALGYLHRHSPPVIHRDIKPANIKITPEGQAMLVDFGIAKVYDPHRKTTVGARAVTPGYSPPEQYGQGTTDHRTDLYALGGTLYTLLTGKQPVESVQRLSGDSLRPANSLNPQLSSDVSQVIGRAMALRPDDRFQSAAEFKSALVDRPAERDVQKVSVPYQPTPAVMPRTVLAPPPQAASPQLVARRSVSGTTRSRSLWIIAAIGAAALLCVISTVGVVSYVIDRQHKLTEEANARATQRQEERNRQTREAIQATSTALAGIVNSTQAAARQTQAALDANSTQVASGTALAQATLSSIASFAGVPSVSLVYGPESGELIVNDKNVAKSPETVLYADFVLEVTFINPYTTSTGYWDVGVLFRDLGANDEYRLIISSEKEWELNNHTGSSDGNKIASGTVPNLDTSEGGSNRLLLVCNGSRGVFYLNGIAIAELDLSARTEGGDIYAGTGFFNKGIAGATVTYERLKIWSIP